MVEKADAQLLFPDGHPPVTGTREVTKAVKALIGLDRAQFNRVAMIAQGEVSPALAGENRGTKQDFSGNFPHGALSKAPGSAAGQKQPSGKAPMRA